MLIFYAYFILLFFTGVTLVGYFNAKGIISLDCDINALFYDFRIELNSVGIGLEVIIILSYHVTGLWPSWNIFLLRVTLEADANVVAEVGMADDDNDGDRIWMPLDMMWLYYNKSSLGIHFLQLST